MERLVQLVRRELLLVAVAAGQAGWLVQMLKEFVVALLILCRE
jgi:hypothetical protein